MFAVAAVAALATAGCGEGAPGMVLSADEYRKQVNDLCRSLNADLGAGSEQFTGRAEDDAEILADSVPKLEDANRKFLGLVPPDELKDAGDTVAFTNQEFLAASQRAATAAEAGDQNAYKFALAELERIDAEGDESAEALGADECVG